MKKIIRWPTLCTRCGSLQHLAKDCDLQAMFGLSIQERRYAAETRRDKQAMLVLLVFLVLAHIGVAVFFGVEP